MPARIKRDATPETIGDPASSPIRDQISQMAPATLADMANAPENTDAEAEPLRGPSGRLLRADGSERAQRRSKKPKESDDPLMNDPRYVKAIQGLNFFGAPRLIKRGFKMVGEKVMHDPDIPLNSEEEEHLDNYFYALSKHTKFDPMATLVGRLLLFVLLMGELIMWRWLKYSPFGAAIKKFLTEQEKTDTETQKPN